MRNRRKFLTIGMLAGLFGVGTLQPAPAQTNPADQEPPPLRVKPPPVPGGVIPLPPGAPPTGQQAPVPASTRPLPGADSPLIASPDLAAVNALVQNKTLTLNDAVAIALYTNRSFAASVAALQKAQGRTGQARSALNPTFGINANVTEYDAATNASFGTQTIPIIPQFNPIITTGITLPLDISGFLHAAANQAQFQEVAARIDVNRTRNQIVFDVKNAFYNVLRAQAQVAVATDSVNNALTRLDDANKNYAAGTAARFDVITAQRDVSDAQRALIDARSQVSLSLASLKNIIGLNMRTSIQISDANAVEQPPGVAPPTVPPVGPDTTTPGTATPPADTPKPAPPIDRTQAAPQDPDGKIVPLTSPSIHQVADTLDLGPEYDAVYQEALRTRPEILESEAQVAAAQRGILFARRSQLPSLSLSLSYVYTPNAVGFTRANEGAATLGVSIPLFDGGLARERVREARADVATAEINRRQAVDQVGLEVQQAYIALTQARNRVAVANVGLAQAREAYRLARVRYNTGVSQQPSVSPQLELSNAQVGLSQAQTNQINALYDYNTARAQLDRAVGRYSYVGHAPGYAASPSLRTVGADKKQDHANP